ncbi:MAG: hypothetical protein E7612_05810, partial [Ruminococcaceae bacterium]|nr:hypothetical protein [Oscillospiraceae bacterium]
MLRRFLFVFLFISVVLFTFSCGANNTCDACVDNNSDGVCDVCKTKIEGEEVKDVVLIEDGETTFQIVL